MWRNRTVYLVGFTLALQGAGCVVEQGSDYDAPGRGYQGPDSGGARAPGGAPGPVTGDSGLSVRWSLAYLDGELIDCDDAGTSRVTLRAEERSTGARFSVSFPCAAGAGVATRVPPGLYDVSLDLLDPPGRPVSGFSYRGVQVFGGRVTEPDRAAVFRVQTWDLLWTIGIANRNGGITSVTCRDVRAVTIRFVTQLGGEPPEAYELPCEDYGAVSTAIRAGNYQVRMLALDYRGQTISDTGPGFYEVTFEEPAALDADFVF
jgi:hypothetical protein